jgi:hypothetical protein
LLEQQHRQYEQTLNNTINDEITTVNINKFDLNSSLIAAKLRLPPDPSTGCNQQVYIHDSALAPVPADQFLLDLNEFYSRTLDFVWLF